MNGINYKVALIACIMEVVTFSFSFCGDIGQSIGKDYFFGTWRTTDFNSNGNRITTYKGQENNNYYEITWTFDGKSENLFHYSDGGTFTQHLINYGNDSTGTNKINETFWRGAYKIKGNSAYSKGKLFLYYEFGIDLYGDGQAGSLTYTDVKDWGESEFLNYAFYGSATSTNTTAELLGNIDEIWANKNLKYNSIYIGSDGKTNDGVTRKTGEVYTASDGVGYYWANGVSIQVRGAKKPICSDIEYFRFNLKDASSSGYARMMATVIDKNGTSSFGGIYNAWVSDSEANDAQLVATYGKKTSYGYKVANACSWAGAQSRYLARISVKSKDDRNPIWVSSASRPNAAIFSLADGRDATDYAGNVDSAIKAEE